MLPVLKDIQRHKEKRGNQDIKDKADALTSNIIWPLFSEDLTTVRKYWSQWIYEAWEYTVDILNLYFSSHSEQDFAILQGQAQGIMQDLEEHGNLNEDARDALGKAIPMMDEMDWSIFRLQLDPTTRGTPSEDLEEIDLNLLIYHEIAYIIIMLAINEAVHSNHSLDRANFLSAWAIQHAQLARQIWSRTVGICPECGDPFLKERSNHRFCSTQHRKNYNTRKVRERQRNAVGLDNATSTWYSRNTLRR